MASCLCESTSIAKHCLLFAVEKCLGKMWNDGGWLALHRELDDALAKTNLPPHPDYESANDFLVTARRLSTCRGFGND